MNTDTNRYDAPSGTLDADTEALLGVAPEQVSDYARVVDVILDDLFLSVGQAIGLRASVEYDAVVWLRSHFRRKFLAALSHQGDRWLDDRAVVTAVAGLFAERAVRYAGGAQSIGVEDVRKAAAEVERYCHAHARRAAGRTGGSSDTATALIAGYWCTWEPRP